MSTASLVTIFFLHMTVGCAILAWWFMSHKQKNMKQFGWGLGGYALGLAVWTLVVLTKPSDLKPMIFIGVIPFLLAHIAFAKAAWKNMNFVWATGILMAVLAVCRIFFFQSEPYFSDEGLLFFGLNSVVIALYVALISVSFLPAIKSVTSEIKNKSTKSVMGIGFTVLYITALLLVSSQDNMLLLMNGVVMTAALVFLWVTALKSR